MSNLFAWCQQPHFITFFLQMTLPHSAPSKKHMFVNRAGHYRLLLHVGKSGPAATKQKNKIPLLQDLSSTSISKAGLYLRVPHKRQPWCLGSCGSQYWPRYKFVSFQNFKRLICCVCPLVLSIPPSGAFESGSSEFLPLVLLKVPEQVYRGDPEVSTGGPGQNWIDFLAPPDRQAQAGRTSAQGGELVCKHGTIGIPFCLHQEQPSSAAALQEFQSADSLCGRGWGSGGG